MTTIRFINQDGKYDMVSGAIGLQVCLDRSMVKEFYRPSEDRWIDPLKDPIRRRPDPSFPTTSDRRRNA